jgi:cytochrome c oxidase subunit III
MASTEILEKDQHHHDDDHGHAPAKEDWSGGAEPFKASYGKLMMWYFLLSDAFTFAGFLIAYGSLRFSMPTWPVPDFVFRTFPFAGETHLPLLFVTVMTFILIVSSVTMVRGVQEGHRGNKGGVVFWMLMTIIGGAMFLGCQAWEWTTLIQGENVSVTRNPFGRHEMDGVYTMDEHGEPYAKGATPEAFKKGDGYIMHALTDHVTHEKVYNKDGVLQFVKREYQNIMDGKLVATPAGEENPKLEFGPKQFGALFFFITGFHGFHVFSGVVFLFIIMINVGSGLYEKRRNHYEMVEKIGLYWHFVDLVWVFVFLVFYLL